MASSEVKHVVAMQETVSDMDDVEQRSWGRLADWMKQRYQGECSAVSAVHRLASEAAFAGQPLPFQLDLQALPPPSPPPPSLMHDCLLLAEGSASGHAFHAALQAPCCPCLVRS